MPQFHGVTIGLGVTLLTPTADGISSQAMVTDGNGTLSFATVGASSPLTLTAGSSSEIPLTIAGASGQTANLQEWTDASDVLGAVVKPGGTISAQYLTVESVGSHNRGFTLETVDGWGLNMAGVAGQLGNDGHGGWSYQGILRFATGFRSTSSAGADVPAMFITGGSRVCIGDVLSSGESTSTARLSVSANQALSVEAWTGVEKQFECAGGTLSDRVTAASGTLATYYANTFTAPTLGAKNTGITATDAATVFVSGAPVAGTNMTLGSSYAVRVGTGGVLIDDTAEFDGSTTAGDIRLMVWDVDNGQMERVTVGAADSGGTGYKVLRIAN